MLRYPYFYLEKVILFPPAGTLISASSGALYYTSGLTPRYSWGQVRTELITAVSSVDIQFHGGSCDNIKGSPDVNTAPPSSRYGFKWVEERGEGGIYPAQQ